MPGSSLELSHACGWKSEVGIAMKIVFDRQVRGVYFGCVYLRVLCFRPLTHAHIAGAVSSCLSQLLYISSDGANRTVGQYPVVPVNSTHC
jgi:hypothetical protein